jgi:hypothetical protein
MGVAFRTLRPMLRTKDLHGTVQFWTGPLGFTCDGLSERTVGRHFPATALD